MIVTIQCPCCSAQLNLTLQPQAALPQNDVSKPETWSFEETWRLYPRHVGKEMARKAWTKAKLSLDTVKVIQAAIIVQKEHGCLKKHEEHGYQYAPHFSTWLNQQRWEDEIAVIEKPASTFEGAVDRLSYEPTHEELNKLFGNSPTINGDDDGASDNPAV